MTRSDVARTAFGLSFVIAGTLHFVVPDYYRAIVPSYLPASAVLVAVSGAAEIAGGLGLLVSPLRPTAGIGLIFLLLAVFPANIEMLRLARARGEPAWAEAVLWLRLPLQALLIWWAWRLSRPNLSSPKLRSLLLAGTIGFGTASVPVAAQQLSAFILAGFQPSW